MEERFLQAHELRATEENGVRKLTGYAAVFNSFSQDLGGFVEIIRPGAFRDALAGGADVRARYNHEQVIGRSTAGTLRLFEDGKGLGYEITLPDTTVARDLMANVRAGNVTGSSFAFGVAGAGGETWRKEGDRNIRELLRVNLFDVGPVDYPAYLGTEGKLGLRSLPPESRAAFDRLGTGGEMRSEFGDAMQVCLDACYAAVSACAVCVAASISSRARV